MIKATKKIIDSLYSKKYIDLKHQSLDFKIIKFSESFIPLNRTKKIEEQLHKNIVFEIYHINPEKLRFPEDNNERNGNYAIIGSTSNFVFKLVAGKRYHNEFEFLTINEALQISNDYKIFYKHLKKSNFIIPQKNDLVIIELDSSIDKRYLILEKQEKFKGKNLLKLIENGNISDKEIMNEFKLITNNMLSLVQNIGKNIGFDAFTPNFLKAGKYIDFLPPKVINGFEFNKLKNNPNDEYCQIKLFRLFNKTGIFTHLLNSFLILRPDLNKEFIEIIRSTIPKKTWGELKKYIDSDFFQISLYYISENYKNILRKGKTRKEINTIVENSRKLIK